MDKEKIGIRLFFCQSIFLALLLLLFASACSSISMPSLPSMPTFAWSTSAPKPDATAEMLFEEGLGFMKDKRYIAAIDRFQRIKTDHPFSPQVVQAELKVAEAYYLNKQYPEAIAAFKEFQSLHPTNENLPFVIYHLGLAHFDQFTSVDRDQKMTDAAKGYFETVIKSYPSSPYAAQSKEKLAKCLEYLAEHEYVVGSFYLRQKRYTAARERFEEIVRRYPETPTAVKALYHLGESYRLQKNSVKAALAYEALLQHYPESPMAKDAKDRLALIEKEKQDPMALLLMRDGRPTSVAALPGQNGDSGEQATAKLPSNLVKKEKVVYEEPGQEKGLFSRALDAVNPFSPSSDQKEEKSKAESVKKEEPAKEKSDGFMASLWGSINPFSGGDKKKVEAGSNPDLVGKVDQSLKQQGLDPQAKDAASTPPKADLPQISEAPAPSPSPAETAELLSKIDNKLVTQGKEADDLPPPPEAAPIFKKASLTEGKPQTAKREDSLNSGTRSLIENIDRALEKKGLEPAKIGVTTKTEEKKPAVAKQPQQKIELSPRLSTEKKPYLLDGNYQKPQEENEKKEEARPEKEEPLKEIPKSVVQDPAELRKQAETKTAKKDPQDEGEKGVLEQLKEDMKGIGSIFNPLDW